MVADSNAADESGTDSEFQEAVAVVEDAEASVGNDSDWDTIAEEVPAEVDVAVTDSD